MFLQVGGDGGRHRGCVGSDGNFHIQAGLGCGCQRVYPHGAYHHVALLVVGEIGDVTLDARRCEEDKHVVVKRLVGGEIIAYRAVHHRRGEFHFVLVQEGCLVVVHVAHGHQVCFLAVLLDEWHQVLDGAGGREENFALAVHNVLLQVVRDGFGHTEVLQRVGHSDAHLAAQAEKVVHGRACSQDDGRKIGNRYLLLAKFTRVQAFNLDKRAEHDFYAMCSLQVEIG